MKQILLNLIEDTKDIEDFTENGAGYAPILGRQCALEKEFNATMVVFNVFEYMPSKIMRSPLQIEKQIWTVEKDGVYTSKIAFLGERSLLTDDKSLDWEDRELEYRYYGCYWFDDLDKALAKFADFHDCEVKEIVQDKEGIWRAPEKKEEEGETGL